MTSIEKPQTVTINGTLFYNAKDLKQFDPEFFKGFKTNIRRVIVKKNISKNNYIYAMWSLNMDGTRVLTKINNCQKKHSCCWPNHG